MLWEGGLAFFGGLLGAILAGYLYAGSRRIAFGRAAEPTTLPWGVTHPASYAPNDGIPRHPVQLYEFFGDLAIAAVLRALRKRLHNGALFIAYLVMFAVLRFLLFFARGDVPVVAWGLKNGHLTALAIVVVVSPWFITVFRRPLTGRHAVAR